jgi:hypothetical protein
MGGGQLKTGVQFNIPSTSAARAEYDDDCYDFGSDSDDDEHEEPSKTVPLKSGGNEVDDDILVDQEVPSGDDDALEFKLEDNVYFDIDVKSDNEWHISFPKPRELGHGNMCAGGPELIHHLCQNG